MAAFTESGLNVALDTILQSEPALATCLLNQGLGSRQCVVAYRAVFQATLNAELAWEAARRQQLLFLRRSQVESSARYAAMKSDVYAMTVDHRRRIEAAAELAQRIARIATMSNPFAALAA